MARVEVRRNGLGVTQDRGEDTFLPFYPTHKGGSGVGLGFALREYSHRHLIGTLCARAMVPCLSEIALCSFRGEASVR